MYTYLVSRQFVLICGLELIVIYYTHCNIDTNILTIFNLVEIPTQSYSVEIHS